MPETDRSLQVDKGFGCTFFLSVPIHVLDNCKLYGKSTPGGSVTAWRRGGDLKVGHTDTPSRASGSFWIFDEVENSASSPPTHRAVPNLPSA